jgi:hypothetical protein
MGVRHELATHELAAVDINSPFMGRPIGVIWATNRQLAGVAIAMIRALEAAAAPLA